MPGIDGRVLITGDRFWDDEELIYKILKVRKAEIVSICHGGAPGADTQGSHAAKRLHIPRYKFEAKWDEYGRSAGPRRNSEMLRRYNPCVVYAFHDHIKKSKGTKDMILKAMRKDVPVLLITHKRLIWLNERRTAKILLQNTTVWVPEEGAETDTRFRWSRGSVHGDGDRQN